MSSLLETIQNKSKYLAQGYDTFWVDGIPYTGFAKATSTWNKSFVQTPPRAIDGAMSTIDDQSTFKVPHYVVNYSVIPIDDFRSLMKRDLDGDKNEMTVRYYDSIYNQITEQKMYLATPPDANSLNYHYEVENGKVYLLGVDNYTVEFIGTNNPVNK